LFLFINPILGIARHPRRALYHISVLYQRACRDCTHNTHRRAYNRQVMLTASFIYNMKPVLRLRDVWRKRVEDHKRLYARMSGVLNTIDCVSIKTKGFAHLFNNLFTPIKNFDWFKHLELENVEWKMLKCKEVIL